MSRPRQPVVGELTPDITLRLIERIGLRPGRLTTLKPEQALALMDLANDHPPRFLLPPKVQGRRGPKRR